MVCYASGPSAALQVGELATMDSSQAVVSCLCVERRASICNLVSLKGFHLPLFITLRHSFVAIFHYLLLYVALRSLYAHFTLTLRPLFITLRQNQ